MAEKRPAQLSKGLLDMKFMKRTKERVEQEEDNAIGTALYSQEVTEAMKEKGEIIIMEANIATCADLIEGRLSYGGMNPAIEKLMEEDKRNRAKRAEQMEKEKDISDAEMAQQQSTLNETIEKKFKTKKQKQKKSKAETAE